MECKSKVFITTLDANAAFDKINNYGMFSKLIKLKVNVYIIRLLLRWYSNFGSHLTGLMSFQVFSKSKVVLDRVA